MRGLSLRDPAFAALGARPPDQIASTFTVTPKSGFVTITSITMPNDNGLPFDPIVPIKIRYRVSGSGTWIDAGPGDKDYDFYQLNNTNFQRRGHIFGLTNETTYEFAIAAQNAAGVGPWSATFTATPSNSYAHADDGTTIYEEFAMRKWRVTSNNYDGPGTAVLLGANESVSLGTSVDESNTTQYIFEYDTSTQPVGVSGNIGAAFVGIRFSLLNPIGNGGFTMFADSNPYWFSPRRENRGSADFAPASLLSTSTVNRYHYVFPSPTPGVNQAATDMTAQTGGTFYLPVNATSRTYLILYSGNQVDDIHAEERVGLQLFSPRLRFRVPAW